MIASLVRQNLKKFKPYESARSLYQEGVFMDANENALGSVAGSSIGTNLNRYPDPFSRDLKKALGKFLGLSEENLFVGNGSDEAIDLLIRLFVEADEEIIITEPTYGMYKVAAETAGVAIKNCQLTKDFQVDSDKLISQINKKTKLLFLCSPNNPTGAFTPSRYIEKICKSFRGIVIVDEAYIEFASKQSLSDKIKRLKNLVVLRTFSKAWGMAGIRVGYAVAQPEIISYLNKIKPPYNINWLSGKLAMQALKRKQKMIKFRNLIVKERKKLSAALKGLGFEVFPSEANFLLVRYPNASQIAKSLADNFGIIIRDFGTKPGLKDCVRISVGTPRQNKSLINTLKTII